MPGAFENGMPRAHHLRQLLVGVGELLVAPRIVLGKPVACDSRCRMVMRGESLVGYFSPASSGT